MNIAEQIRFDAYLFAVKCKGVGVSFDEEKVAENARRIVAWCMEREGEEADAADRLQCLHKVWENKVGNMGFNRLTDWASTLYGFTKPQPEATPPIATLENLEPPKAETKPDETTVIPPAGDGEPEGPSAGRKPRRQRRPSSR